MEKLIINSYEEFEKYLGQPLGQSDWLQVNQDRINLFADATLDHQWIHVDQERAKEGPFGTTIVHGYLTLSLLPYLWEQIIQVNNIKMLVNYGMDKMRFGQAVPVGSRQERSERAPEHEARKHCQPPRHLQGRNQVLHRHQGRAQACPDRCGHLPLPL